MTREQVATATGLVDTFELDTPRGLWRVTLSDARRAVPDGVHLVFSYEGPEYGNVQLRVSEVEATSEHVLRGTLRDILARQPLPHESETIELS